MDILSQSLSILKYGISEFFALFKDAIGSVTGLGLTIIFSLLGISLLWRYILSPFFK